MAADADTNIVKPKIGGVSEIWFDPRAGKTKPEFIKGPYEGNANPQVVSVSVDQSKPNGKFLVGATLIRSADDLELYRTQDLNEDTKLIFCENKARITNAELTAGTNFYAKGVSSTLNVPTDVQLTLDIDRLDATERKYTDFNDNNKVKRWVNVEVNNVPTKTVQVISADLVTPILAPGRADVCVRPGNDPLPIAISLAYVRNTNKNLVYTGKGELKLTPADAKVKVYSSPNCLLNEEIPFNAGLAELSEADLTGGVTYYAKASQDDVSGRFSLSLELKPTCDTKALIPALVPTCWVRLESQNVVTPKLDVVIDPTHDGVIWRPSLTSGALPQLKLSVTQSKPAIPYGGNGLLTRSNDRVDVYHDQNLTQPVSFADNKAVILNADLKNADKVYYLKGRSAGACELSLQVYQPQRKSIVIGDPDKADVVVKDVTRVEQHTDWGSNQVSANSNTPIDLYITQTPPDGPQYAETVTLVRSNTSLQLLNAQHQDVFRASETKVQLGLDRLRKADCPFYVNWTGGENANAALNFEFELPKSAKPYIITDAETQLRKDQPAQPLNLIGQDVNEVTPTIQTDYDLVLVSSGFADQGNDKQTSPTNAYIAISQTHEDIGYNGNGVLRRENDNIRLFLDADCREEVTFVNNEAVIANADLLNAQKCYYLRGIKAGKTGLSLQLESGNQQDFGMSRYVIKQGQDKFLGVIRLDMELYRNDATADPVVNVPMSDREKRLYGRFLHAKNNPNPNSLVAQNDIVSRAKMVLKAVDTSVWPQSADKHLITLNLSDRARVYKDQEGGDTLATTLHPLVLEKGKLGQDNTFWLSSKGGQFSVLRGEVYALGMMRDDTSKVSFPKAQTPIEPKNNGDWCCASVVEITQLTPNIQNWRQYTNQPPVRTETYNSNQNASKNGRSILVTATVSPAIPGVGVDFMLWADPQNKKDIPDDLKCMDVKLHGVGVTDQNGRASAELKLSSYGGDKYRGVCFLSDEAKAGKAQFSKGITQVPSAQKSDVVTTWRKLNMELIFMRRHANAPYNGDYRDMFDAAQLNQAFASSYLEFEVDNGGVPTLTNNVAALWDVRGLAGGMSFDAWYNGEVAAGRFQRPRDRWFSLIFVETVYEGATIIQDWYTNTRVEGNVFYARLKNQLFDLGDKSRYLVSNKCKVSNRGQWFVADWEEDVPDGQVSIVDAGGGQYELRVDLTAVPLHNRSISKLSVQVQLKRLNYFCGMSLPTLPVTVTGVRYAEQRASRQRDEVYATTVHEVGHFLGLTSSQKPDAARSKNLIWYHGGKWLVSGIRKAQTRYYISDNKTPPTFTRKDEPGMIGQGPHCWDGFRDFTDLQKNHGKSSKVKCLMFDSTTTPPITRVCDTCKGTARARPYTLGNTDSDVNF